MIGILFTAAHIIRDTVQSICEQDWFSALDNVTGVLNVISIGI